MNTQEGASHSADVFFPTEILTQDGHVIGFVNPRTFEVVCVSGRERDIWGTLSTVPQEIRRATASNEINEF